MLSETLEGTSDTHTQDYTNQYKHSDALDSRGEAVNHVCIFDEHQIQPTASPLPACGHAHLLPPSLKQLSDLLKTTRWAQTVKWSLLQLVIGGSVAKAPLGGAVWKQSCSSSPAVFCTHKVFTWFKGLLCFYVMFAWLMGGVSYCVCPLTLLCSEGKAPMPTLVVYAFTTP